MSKDQTRVIEKLLTTLTKEQQMRLKSEEQHSQMVDQLVKNQVKLEQQLKLHKDRSSSALGDTAKRLIGLPEVEEYDQSSNGTISIKSGGRTPKVHYAQEYTDN